MTVADFAAQAVIAMTLRDELGDSIIVGEEDADELRRDDNAAIRAAVIDAVRTQRPTATEQDVLDAIDACDHDGHGDAYWALDPVDGTKGFVNGPPVRDLPRADRRWRGRARRACVPQPPDGARSRP